MIFFKEKKTCPRCNESRDISEFDLKKLSVEDGKTLICNICGEYELLVHKGLAVKYQEELQTKFRASLGIKYKPHVRIICNSQGCGRSELKPLDDYNNDKHCTACKGTNTEIAGEAFTEEEYYKIKRWSNI